MSTVNRLEHSGTAYDITQRKQTEDALQESENRFRTAFLTSPDSININRLEDGMFMFINQGFSEITGYNQDEVIGKTSKEINIWDDYGDREKLVAGLKDTGTVNNLKARFRMKNGRVITGLMSARVMMLNDEPHILSITRDIHELEQIIASLNSRIEELAALNSLNQRISSQPHLSDIISSALQSLIDTVHPDAALFFLREDQKLLLEAIRPDQARERLGDITEHRVGESMCGLAVTENQPLYAQSINQDERCTWDECKRAGFRSFAALPVRGSSDQVIGVIGLASDAERDFENQASFLETMAGQVGISMENAHLYESGLQKSKNLEALLEISQVLTSTLDMQSILQMIVESAIKITGLDTGALYLLRGEELYLGATEPPLPPQFPMEFRQAQLADHPHIQLAIVSGQPIILPDTEQADLTKAERGVSEARGLRSILYVPLMIEKRPAGTLILGSIGKTHTFTERETNLSMTLASQAVLSIENARLFEEIQNNALELEKRVAERTAELQVANKELESFTYSVSHDLRAPLRAINGFTEIIASRHHSKLNTEGRHYFDNIIKASQQMEKLIDDLLSYARLGQTKSTPSNLSHSRKSWWIWSPNFNRPLKRPKEKSILPRICQL